MRALRQPVTVPEATRSAATSDGKSTCKPCCLEDGLIATDPHVAAGAILDGGCCSCPRAGTPARGTATPARDAKGDGEGKYHKQLSEKAFDQL